MSEGVDWTVVKGFTPADVSGHLDPRNVYVLRAQNLAASSKGYERFAYLLFGPELMSSLAFALDPYSRIRLPVRHITPANRTYNFAGVSYTKRGSVRDGNVHDCRNNTDPSTPELDVTAVACTDTPVTPVNSTWVAQEQIYGFRLDTTRRTRGSGSDGGTFELWAPYVSSPSRSYVRRTYYYFEQDYFGSVLSIRTNAAYSRRTTGPWARWRKVDIDALKPQEQGFASTMMSKHGYQLVRQCLPTRRRFQGFYNVAELKDLPMMLRHTTELLTHPIKSVTSTRGAGNQYLNYQFGWESTLRSIRQMLSLPQKITNQVNYLISRQGKDSTYRSRYKAVDSLSSAPLFKYDQLYSDEAVKSTGVSSVREWELRCVLNFAIQLPTIALPILRRDLLEKAWGAQPRPIDVYNLVPWTWLLDWFSGLGDYIGILDTMYSDPNLVNYGYLTYSSECKIKGVLRTTTTDTVAIRSYPKPWYNSSEITTHRYAAETGYRYQKRIDISDLPDVKTLNDPTSLGVDQLAILGALISKFT